MLCKMGLYCHPKTVASKSKKLGKAHDQELLNWKKTLQRNDEIKRGAEMLKDEMNALSYLPELPSAAEFQAYAEELKQPAPTTSTSCPLPALNALTWQSTSTLDVTCLNLTCANEPQTVVRNISSKLLDSGISRDGLIGCIEQMVHLTPPQTLETPALGYQITGDNCDLHVNIRHMITCQMFIKQLSRMCLSDLSSKNLKGIL